MTIIRKDSALGEGVELARTLKASYGVFRSALGQVVLRDLAAFCNANVSTFHTDARIDAYQQGQRSVWLHISQRLHLTVEELYQLCRGGRIPQETE